MMPQSLYGWLAVGGAIAALGPIIIHLLNRRRFKVVNWAAMHLLREAVKRNRRILEIRDLILLALRTLAAGLIGVALAGPYFSCSSADSQPNVPLHAILVIDNGTSMGYDRSGETLLAVAQRKAKEFIDLLPARSRVTVIPLCGPEGDFSLDAYPTLTEAKAGVDKVTLVDRQNTPLDIVKLAESSGERVADLPSKRVVFFSDQQASKWPQGSLADTFKKLDDLHSDLQLVTVQHLSKDGVPLPLENTWIEKFSVVDDFADVESPATFIATVRHQGTAERTNVEVKLQIDVPNAEPIIQNQRIDLQPNSAGVEVTFKAQIPVTIKDNKPQYVGATVSLPEDFLSADNHRHLTVPVLAKVPVVFIDQFGREEDPKHNKVGETRPLRQLLAPQTTRGDAAPQLIAVRRLRIDEVTQEHLRDARMVIIAGVERPERAVPDLRDYVRQGGQLVIAAGGNFDPVAWNDEAWRNGDGILPVPLAGTVGKTLEESPKELTPFFLNFDTLSKAEFTIPGESREAQLDLYSAPFFIKAVQTDVGDETLQKLLKAEHDRQEKQRAAEAEYREKIAGLMRKKDAQGLSVSEQTELSDLETRLSEVAPHWLMFGTGAGADLQVTLEQAVEQSRPKVLGKFTNQVPFAVERQMGKGKVLFIATGIASGWNSVSVTNAIVMYERMLRPRLRGTLPQYTIDLGNAAEVKLPVAASERNLQYKLLRPDEKVAEPLSVESLGANEYGLTLRKLKKRGIYQVQTFRPDMAATADGPTPINVLPLAANGPANASELRVVDLKLLKERFGDAPVRIVETGEQNASVSGSQIWAQNLWWILTAVVFILLLTEMLVLAWPALKPQGAVA